MTKKKKAASPRCASCGHERTKKICMNEAGSSSKGCPTIAYQDVFAEADKEYDRPEIHELARQASRQEGDGYANRHQRPYVIQPAKTRMVEICEFAEKMNYRRLGLAFCIGLSREAGIVEGILEDRGFEVVSVMCKAGRTLKERIGIKDEEKVCQGTDEAMCNPIFQAKVLNQQKVDFNILLGLCVGHDSIFFKYVEAPTTVLAVKDRVTGHNPLAAIYLSDFYYQKIKQA